MRKKRIIYTVILIFLLALFSGVGWLYNTKSYRVFDKNMESLKGETLPGEARMVSNVKDEKNDYFFDTRMNRESARAKAIDEFEKMLENPNVSAETKKECEQSMIKINENIVMEQDAESLIKSKGFSDVVVFINTSSVTVTVRAEKLTSPQITQIKDIISEFVSIKNIKIVEVS